LKKEGLLKADQAGSNELAVESKMDTWEEEYDFLISGIGALK
jgi:hypothetical protein